MQYCWRTKNETKRSIRLKSIMQNTHTYRYISLNNDTTWKRKKTIKKTKNNLEKLSLFPVRSHVINFKCNRVTERNKRVADKISIFKKEFFYKFVEIFGHYSEQKKFKTAEQKMHFLITCVTGTYNVDNTLEQLQYWIWTLTRNKAAACQ